MITDCFSFQCTAPPVNFVKIITLFFPAKNISCYDFSFYFQTNMVYYEPGISQYQRGRRSE
ncbi:hypothetical protein CLOSTHATH_05928 [Hungatella hathewayi DSM 13479]|uniref:Uncharacterized protein n=1 Tax=Hungatella hathewayi DSM 13479 TaxID=566550 RepID=D3AQM2_9FIRM|nr:hypothetical protein CLOSTHATH_05928 [Hungatella hathewayi DSM 13479]